MDIIEVFGSQPRFQFGDYVFSRVTYTHSDGDVTHCKHYGVIVGIEFCKEYSMYCGWVYMLQHYKSIAVEGSEKSIDLGNYVTPIILKETELSLCPRKIDILKIINRLKIAQLKIIKSNLK